MKACRARGLRGGRLGTQTRCRAQDPTGAGGKCLASTPQPWDSILLGKGITDTPANWKQGAQAHSKSCPAARARCSRKLAPVGPKWDSGKCGTAHRSSSERVPGHSDPGVCDTRVLGGNTATWLQLNSHLYRTSAGKAPEPTSVHPPARTQLSCPHVPDNRQHSPAAVSFLLPFPAPSDPAPRAQSTLSKSCTSSCAPCYSAKP